MASPLAEAIVAIGMDDRTLRSQMTAVNRYIRSQVNILTHMLGSIVFGKVVKEGVELDTTLNRVRANLRASGESAAEAADHVEEFEEAARKIGVTTLHSSAQAAAAMQELVQLGFTARDAMTALPNVLNLASAGQLKMGEAATIVGTSLNQFSLAAGETQRVVDVLAAAQALGAATVKDLGVAMSYAGPSAAQLGYSYEETAAAATLLSTAGLKASRMGTGLDSIFSRLARAVKVGWLDEFNIQVLNSDNSIKSLVEIVGEFKKKMDGLAPIAKQAYIKKIAEIRGGTALMALINMGPDKLRLMTLELENARGRAEMMRLEMEKGLSGAWAKFTATMSTGTAEIARRLTIIPGLLGVIAEGFRRFVAAGAETRQAVASMGEFLGVLIGVRLILPRIIAMVSLMAGVFTGPMNAAFLVIQSLVGVIGSLITGVAALGTAAGIASLAVGALTLGLGAIAALLTGGLAVAAAAFTLGFAGAFRDAKLAGPLNDDLRAIQTSLEDMAAQLMGLAGGESAWQALKDGAAGFIAEVRTFLMTEGPAINETLAEIGVVGRQAFEFIKGQFQEFAAAASSTFGKVRQYVIDNADEIRGNFATALHLALNLVNNLEEAALALGVALALAFRRALLPLFILVTVIEELGPKIETITFYTNDLSETWEFMWSKMLLSMSKFEDDVNSFIDQLKTAFIALWKGLGAAAAVFFENLPKKMALAGAELIAEAAGAAAGTAAALDPTTSKSYSEAKEEMKKSVMEDARAEVGELGDPLEAFKKARDEVFKERPIKGPSDKTKELEARVEASTLKLDELDRARKEKIAKAMKLPDIPKGPAEFVGPPPPPPAWGNIWDELWGPAVRAGGKREGGIMPRDTSKDKIQFSGITEMWKKIQEGLTGKKKEALDKRAADAAARGADADEEAVGLLADIRDGIDGIPDKMTGTFAA